MNIDVFQLGEHAIEVAAIDGDDYDCLLEAMRVECANVRVYAGRRVPPISSSSRSRSGGSQQQQQRAATKKSSGGVVRRLGEQIFENFNFLVDPFDVLDRQFPLVIEVYRNLSSFISHNCEPRKRCAASAQRRRSLQCRSSQLSRTLRMSSFALPPTSIAFCAVSSRTISATRSFRCPRRFRSKFCRFT